jgi:hypothetical protein
VVVSDTKTRPQFLTAFVANARPFRDSVFNRATAYRNVVVAMMQEIATGNCLRTGLVADELRATTSKEISSNSKE